MYKILIVEDEISAREGLKNLIETQKDIYIVYTAKDGLEGFNKAQKILPDIIITDIKMPKLNGLEMIQKLHNLSLDTKFIILSGYAEFEYAQSAIRFGVKDYILKPIVPIQVFDLLKKHIKTIEKESKNFLQFKRENFTIITQSDEDILIDFYKNKKITHFFCATIYLPPGRYLSEKRKTFILQNPNLTLLYSSNKNFVNIIEPYFFVTTSLFSELKILTMEEPSFVCCYNICSFNDNVSLLHNFKQLASCIPWSISFNKNFFILEDYMLKSPQNPIENHELKNSIRNTFYNQNYKSCQTILIAFLKDLQGKKYHPKQFMILATSCLFKTDNYGVWEDFNNYNELIFIQTINKIMSSNTFFELETAIRSYYSQIASIEYNEIYSKPILIAINEIKNNYQQPLTLNLLAEKIDITPQYLSRLFTTETSQNFTDYLTSYRITKAKHLLNSTNLKIYEIAEQVGYYNAKYFCTVFKKISGTSPNQFRRNNK